MSKRQILIWCVYQWNRKLMGHEIQLSTLLGTPLHRLLQPIMWQQRKCWSGNVCSIYQNRRNDVISVAGIVARLLMPDRLLWVFQKISWDFHAQQFTRNDMKTQKASSEQECSGQNHLTDERDQRRTVRLLREINIYNHSDTKSISEHIPCPTMRWMSYSSIKPHQVVFKNSKPKKDNVLFLSFYLTSKSK